MRLHILCFSIAILTFMSCINDKATPIGAIFSSEEFTVYTDSVVQGDFVARAIAVNKSTLDSINPGYPKYHSDQPLIDNLFAMAINEISSTRKFSDIAYATYLSIASISPDKALRQLCDQLKDTPSGTIITPNESSTESWPVATDRIAWATGIWEIYKSTGDSTILIKALHAIENTINDDMRAAWNDRYKLMRGKMTLPQGCDPFYPEWMQPIDIYESMSLGTNIMFANAFAVRDSITREVHDGNFVPMWVGINNDIANSLNTCLWIPKSGFYGQYLYGGFYPVTSQANDNFAQALAIIFDIANPEMAKSIIGRTPDVPCGIPSFFPIPSDSAHYNRFHPMTQAFWNIAAAKARNMQAVEKGLASFIRNAVFHSIGNKRLFSSSGITPDTTSGKQWDSAGMAAMVLRVILGMSLTSHSIEFNPIVPNSLPGEKTLSGLKYKGSNLTVKLYGTGESIKMFSVNGTPQSDHSLQDTVNGNVTIEITMDNRPARQSRTTSSPWEYMPETPVIKWTMPGISLIENHQDGTTYDTFINSNFTDKTTADSVIIAECPNYTVAGIVAVNENGYSGFIDKPHEYIPPATAIIIPSSSMSRTGTALINDRKQANRFVESTASYNTALHFNVTTDTGGDYLFDVSYAKGKGGSDQGRNKCAIRILYIDGAEAGAVVMPQQSSWESAGFSNKLHLKLKSGVNHFTLKHGLENMDNDNNTALIEYARIIRQ